MSTAKDRKTYCEAWNAHINQLDLLFIAAGTSAADRARIREELWANLDKAAAWSFRDTSGDEYGYPRGDA